MRVFAARHSDGSFSPGAREGSRRACSCPHHQARTSDSQFPMRLASSPAWLRQGESRLRCPSFQTCFLVETLETATSKETHITTREHTPRTAALELNADITAVHGLIDVLQPRQRSLQAAGQVHSSRVAHPNQLAAQGLYRPAINETL